jgi:hypothetical protein
MSWQDFEDYEAEVRMILPDLGRQPYVTMSIVDGYKTKLTPEQVSDRFIANSPCDFSSVSQVATMKFDTEDEAKRFFEVMQDVGFDAKYRAVRHILDEQNKGKSK